MAADVHVTRAPAVPAGAVAVGEAMKSAPGTDQRAMLCCRESQVASPVCAVSPKPPAEGPTTVPSPQLSPVRGSDRRWRV